MRRYAFLVLPSHNRVYADAAPSLARAELAVLSAALPDGAIDADSVAETVIGGVPYVTFEAGELSERDADLLANLSSLYALFEVTGELLRPVELRRLDRFDDDLLTILKYPGKTNEQFTKLLFNVTLASSHADAATTSGSRLRVLDPVCGRGTSLNQGLVYGFDVDGIEIDRAAYDAYHAFLVTWLKDKRYKHQVHTMPLRREGKVVGRRFEIVFARDKDEYKAGDVQRVRFVNDDTTEAGEHYRKPVFDAVVADLPYGVQHASRARPDAKSRRPEDLLDAALPGWIGAMKPGAAMGLSWNTKVLKRDALVDILARHGLDLAPATAGTSFEHRVDQAITRDLVVAVKPA
jgi:hypothetical protein